MQPEADEVARWIALGDYDHHLDLLDDAVKKRQDDRPAVDAMAVLNETVQTVADLRTEKRLDVKAARGSELHHRLQRILFDDRLPMRVRLYGVGVDAEILETCLGVPGNFAIERVFENFGENCLGVTVLPHKRAQQQPEDHQGDADAAPNDERQGA